MNKPLITTIIAALMLALPAMARTTVEQAFTSAPQDVFMLLDRNARLDMIDYFKANQSVAVKNILDGASRITSLSPESMTIEMTPSSTYQLALLPTAKEENDVVALVVTVTTPARDSRISFYKAADWSRLDAKKLFPEPMLADWLSESGKANRSLVEAMVPFIMAYYTYDPATATLTVSHDLATFLSAPIYETVKGYLLPSISYKWNGKKFAIVKDAQ